MGLTKAKSFSSVPNKRINVTFLNGQMIHKSQLPNQEVGWATKVLREVERGNKLQLAAHVEERDTQRDPNAVL